MSAAEDKTLENTAPQTLNLPVLPLRDVVVYPHMVIPLFVGRDKSIRALEQAMVEDKRIVLVAQKSATDDDPTPDDIYRIGSIANILQLLKLPDGTIKVLVEGENRVEVDNFVSLEEYYTADVHIVKSILNEDKEMDVMSRSIVNQFEQYIKLNKKVPPEILTSLNNIEEPGRLTDSIAAHIAVKLDEKQKMLEMLDIKQRMERLISLMDSEIDLLQVEKRIRKRVKGQMEKSQREYYLNEQIKAIQKELGEGEETPNELEELNEKIRKAGMPKEALEKTKSEFSKLKMMSPMSAEATVVRNYIDIMTAVPWKKRTEINRNLAKAATILENDHYGLDKVKERILEYLAVQQRVKKLKGPILCLVGPPGVGKTSLGESIARSTNRKFIRMALGGVRDEAEIRGHRRTYIGSMPGKIIQNLSKIKTKNPMFLLDEVDKMSMDFRGDPSSALLEVLDPEQNHSFNDHYLEVDYDLSDVMFIATANSLDIPAPLLDRMEVINIPGYIEDEKLRIAEKYLLPKQLKNNGLDTDELQISSNTLRDIIRYYTREAGVRNLEREISKICRKVVKSILLDKAKKKTKQIKVSSRSLEKYLGVRRFRFGLADEQNRIGQVTGLAWTQVGGELLTIEAALMQGKGKLSYTGQLGDVMQESIQAAMTVVRGRAETLGISSDFYQKNDLHIHVPEGATPKDGPSAGVSMCTALVSVLTGIPVRADVAMTGEITLRGEVLPIGGLKEKLLAALRGGIKTVLIPSENQRDLTEIPANIKKHLHIKPVKWVEEVLDAALERMPTPIETQTDASLSKASVSDEQKKVSQSIRTH